MAQSNKATFKEGWNKFREAADKQLHDALVNVMTKQLLDAINEWEKSGSNLTGNLQASYGAALYKQGSVDLIRLAQQFGVPQPTHGYTHPGDKGFVDIDTGELIGTDGDWGVKEYREYPGRRFQPVPNGKGNSDAMSFLYNFPAPSSALFYVVICNAVPYAQYMEQKVGYSVLQESAMNADINVEKNLVAFYKAHEIKL